MSSRTPASCTSTTGRRRAGRITALSATAALGLAVTTMVAPAWAHDSLIASTPEADAVLEGSPEEVTLEFSGDGLTTGDSITNVIEVSDDEGENWEGETEIEGSTMWTELPEELPGGDYTVAYRVVYSDGHAEESSFGFEVAETEPEPTPEPSAPAETETDAEAEAQTDAGTESAASAEDDDADPTTPDSTEDTADADQTGEPGAGEAAADTQLGLGLPVWGVVAGAAIVLGALTAVVVAGLRRRARRRS